MIPHRGRVAILALAGIALFGPHGQETSRVEIAGLRFSPNHLRLAVGDTVIWINHDIVPHTVTGPGGRPDSGEIPAGGSFTLVVTVGIGGRYYCRYHPDMTLGLRVN